MPKRILKVCILFGSWIVASLFGRVFSNNVPTDMTSSTITDATTTTATTTVMSTLPSTTTEAKTMITTTTWTTTTTTNSPSTVDANTNCTEAVIKQCVADFIHRYPSVPLNAFTSSAVTRLQESCRTSESFGSCITMIEPNCNASTLLSRLDSLRPLLGYLCTPDGLQISAMPCFDSSSRCRGAEMFNILVALNKSTEQFCRAASDRLNCSQESSDCWIFNYEHDFGLTKAVIVNPLQKELNCTSPTPRPPRDKGQGSASPAGVSAIVVLICLVISAILATMFFWPKCHHRRRSTAPQWVKQKAAKVRAAPQAQYVVSNKDSEVPPSHRAKVVVPSRGPTAA